MNKLIIFIKAPKIGKVKTRLAKSVGDKNALLIYKSLVKRILFNVKGICLKTIYYSQTKDKDEIEKWLKNYDLTPQVGETLGEKMANGFENEFNNGMEKVICIGSDIPEITKEIIEKAFNKLENNDCVIGPAKDGGYYLIAFNKDKFDKVFFQSINWGTENVFKETIKLLKNQNMNYFQLEMLNDIDTSLDYEKYIERKYFQTLKKENKS